MQFKNIILHLSLIQQVGSKTIQQLVNQVGKQNLQDLYGFSSEDFVRFGLPERIALLVEQGLKDVSLVEQELGVIQQHQAHFVSIVCEEYPPLLQQIEVPPAVLYYRGNVDVFKQEKTLACVGARKAHSYVQDCLIDIVAPLIKHNWVVVSGGAIGADTYAHSIAVDNEGLTIAVLGSGLCHQYPYKNKTLFDQIVQSGGLIVSPFPMQMLPEARCFPIRNRIISGLSIGCLVLQAARKSGALITAQFALEQGREVFAVPGPIYDPLSVGCHDLIQQGAKLVQKTEDIVDELSMIITEHSDQQATFIDQVQDKQRELLYQDDTERLILQAVVHSISMQDLMLKVPIEFKALQEKLFALSLEGKIEQDCMGLWKRC